MLSAVFCFLVTIKFYKMENQILSESLKKHIQNYRDMQKSREGNSLLEHIAKKSMNVISVYRETLGNEGFTVEIRESDNFFSFKFYINDNFSFSIIQNYCHISNYFKLETLHPLHRAATIRKEIDSYKVDEWSENYFQNIFQKLVSQGLEKIFNQKDDTFG